MITLRILWKRSERDSSCMAFVRGSSQNFSWYKFTNTSRSHNMHYHEKIEL